MSEIILVVGGSRSGKSDYAQGRTEQFGKKCCYIATCPAPTVKDREMADRIDRHRRKRPENVWYTLEEELDLVGALGIPDADDAVLIDCLTLWVNNVIYHNAHPDQLSEEWWQERTDKLMDACRERKSPVILVTSEVGCGIVPENEISRTFRDFVGICNQTAAYRADQVVLVTCGIPVTIK